MTLIGFTTGPRSADLVTDTLSYKRGLGAMGHTTKYVHAAHLDALIVTGGDGLFGDYMKVTLMAAANQIATFDQLTDSCQQRCRESWEGLGNDRDQSIYETTVFLLGYSVTRERFVAFRYDSENDFTGVECQGLTLQPTPFTDRPSHTEAERIRSDLLTTYADSTEDTEDINGFIDRWLDQDEIPVKQPMTADYWRTIARRCRQNRALAERPDLRVLIGGQLIHTRIERGALKSSIIHKFNDRGDELVRMVAGTHHPIAQMSPCVCGSAQLALECCLAEDIGEPCGCGSGRNFEDCCMVQRASIDSSAVGVGVTA